MKSPSHPVSTYWLKGTGDPSSPAIPGTCVVHVDAQLPANRHLSLIEPCTGANRLLLRPETGTRLGLTTGTVLSERDLAHLMEQAGLRFHGPDLLFYFPNNARSALRAEPRELEVRLLTQDDALAFDKFSSALAEDERDEAFVELDHWLVAGAFVEGHLACAASMYPWSSSPFADVGVITAGRFRGRGLARKVLWTISAEALSLGQEPQFRCRPDNLASAALARAAGMALFGQWTVVRSAEN